MGILQWIKKLFSINKIKQLEEPKTINKSDNWKDAYKHNGHNVIEKKLILEEKRREQIKLIEQFILYKEESLLKEEIWEKILDNYEENVLENTDMQALIVLYGATKYQDVRGDSEIRDFIEDGKYNIVKLVDAMIEKAKKEAKIYKDIDACDLIDGSMESINEIIKELENNKISEDELEI